MSQSQDIVTEVAHGVRTIRLNRPKVKNAIDSDMFMMIANLLNQDANNDEVKLVIITGTGEYFTSGFDITKQMKMASEDPEAIIYHATQVFKNFIDALINFPKILITFVNGPAVGAGVTMLGLCDVVYASDTATFRTPFTKLGLVPEGCSSFLFPNIMGRSLASEMLLFGRTLSAQEALATGLISKVVPKNNILQFIEELKQYSKIPLETSMRNKELITGNLQKKLREVNAEECVKLMDSFKSEAFAMSMMEFMTRKSKL